MPAVGDSPAFIAALKDLVLHSVEVHAEGPPPPCCSSPL
jgi:hypothetical protein